MTTEAAPSRPLTLLVMIASTRTERGGPAVGAWFTGLAQQRPDLVLDVLDLAEAALPDVGTTDGSAFVVNVSARLRAADAFAVVTPEYNHSFPGPLKNAIDSFGKEWHAKPVGFVSYGGISGGLRAVEHLRPVFAEVHATSIRDTLSFANYWEHFNEDGRFIGSDGSDAAAGRFLHQLAWWGSALRDARNGTAYPA